MIETNNALYRVSRISINNENVTIKVIENQEYEITYKIRIDDYLELNYQKDNEISQIQIEELQRLHLYNYAYNKCLKKLSSSDKTEYEIRQVLNHIDGLPTQDIEDIVKVLKELGYINDQSVADSQLYIDQQKLLGKSKTIYNMRKRGISPDIISDSIHNIDESSEIERGVARAQRELKKCQNRSYRDTINVLRNKLFSEGFIDIDAIITNIDLKKDENRERHLIESMVEKTINKYNKRYQGRQLYSRIYNYLLSKGYDREDITSVLAEKELINENK